MQVNVRHTVKTTVIDFSSGYQELEFVLNSGLRLPVSHVVIDDSESNANIHLVNDKVIINVPIDSIDFDRDENEMALKISRGEIPAPSPKKGRCCGG